MTVAVGGLLKRFNGGPQAAVNGVSFTAPTGKLTALLGPSGSGKTTLLRLIAGLESPQAGSIHLNGQDCTTQGVQERQVGFVFQGYALFEHLTVFDNVAFGLRLRAHNKTEVRARVEELLALVELTPLAGRFPRHLSGGQKQRVAFARALAIRPRVLLLDEPFAALDARVRHELRSWLMELHRRTHVTTLLVTHDQEEALEVADHVVILNRGEVVQSGSPHDVYDAPANAFVAAFLGKSAVLKGHVEAGQVHLGGVVLQAPLGTADGARLQAFVRPEEARLWRDPHGSARQAEVEVTALSRVGGYVLVEVRLAGHQSVVVKITRLEAQKLALTLGDRVYMDVADPKMFPEEEYVI